MATLTGFKRVAESNKSSSGMRQDAGDRSNPVFVLEDAESRNEVYVDASGDLHASAAAKSCGQVEIQISQPAAEAAARQPPQTQTLTSTSTSTSTSTTSPVTIKTTTTTTTPTAPTAAAAAAASNTTNCAASNNNSNQQQNSFGHDNNKSKFYSSNLLSPEGADLNGHQADGDNNSVSMLAIDCVGTGKSPRQPRRSPLMALFRGKQRESTRKLYTDEDQFEIEWTNLRLSVQKKWYQKLSPLGALAANSQSGAEDKTACREQAKMILKSVDGCIRSGEITAILGPSGAGKTSLLNSLFGKHRSAVEGSIRVTGAPSKKNLTVCTIPQSDYLIGNLTTEEALWFASRLKNCDFDFNHDRNIERVIELLGLQRCRHTRINKLSGGQYKRVSIAQEMLSSPDILVLDEPTSGLDSLTCYRTVKVLRDLVEASKAHNLVNPMSIVLTIHQPHREVLDLFHSVYVMAVGGMTLFQGAPGDMEDFIHNYSGTSMPAEGYNPASFMVELASEEYGHKPIELLVAKQRERFILQTQHKRQPVAAPANAAGLAARTSSLTSLAGAAQHHAESTIALYPLEGAGRQQQQRDTFVDIDLSRAQMRKTRSSYSVSGDKKTHAHQAPCRDIDSRILTPRSGKNSDGVFWRHVSLMSKRCFLSSTRDPLLCTIRIGAHIFIPLVVALIYGPKMGIPNGCPFYKPEINLLEYASIGVEEIADKHDDIRIQFQNVGLHFMVYYAFGLCMLAFTAISFPLIMHVLIKEIRNGWYSLATFVIGKMFAELPMALVLPPISVGIIYVMTGQPSSEWQWRYLIQSLILILIVMIAEAKGLIFGAVCMNSMQTAVFAASVSTVPFILLSGFLIRIREIPFVLQYFANFSYFKHGVEALIITRYGFGMCPCDADLIPAGGTPRIIGIPAQIMSLTDYYINSYVAPTDAGANSTGESDEHTRDMGNNRSVKTIIDAVTTLASEIDTAADTTLADIIATTPQPAQPETETETEPEPEPETEPEAAAAAAAVAAAAAAATTTTTTAPQTGTQLPADTISGQPTARQVRDVVLARRLKRAATRKATTTTTTTTTTTESPDDEPSEDDSSIPDNSDANNKPHKAENSADEDTQSNKPKQGVFFDKLATLLTRANAFGFKVETCEDVAPFTMKDMQLKDNMLAGLIGALAISIVVLRFLSYFIVDFCVKTKL